MYIIIIKTSLNVEIADGANENFKQLVLASGTRSLPPLSIRLLSQSEDVWSH